MIHVAFTSRSAGTSSGRPLPAGGLRAAARDILERDPCAVVMDSEIEITATDEEMYRLQLEYVLAELRRLHLELVRKAAEERAAALQAATPDPFLTPQDPPALAA